MVKNPWPWLIFDAMMITSCVFMWLNKTRKSVGIYFLANAIFFITYVLWYLSQTSISGDDYMITLIIFGVIFLIVEIPCIVSYLLKKESKNPYRMPIVAAIFMTVISLAIGFVGLGTFFGFSNFIRLNSIMSGRINIAIIFPIIAIVSLFFAKKLSSLENNSVEDVSTNN